MALATSLSMYGLRTQHWTVRYMICCIILGPKMKGPFSVKVKISPHVRIPFQSTVKITVTLQARIAIWLSPARIAAWWWTGNNRPKSFWKQGDRAWKASHTNLDSQLSMESLRSKIGCIIVTTVPSYFAAGLFFSHWHYGRLPAEFATSKKPFQ